MDQKLIIDNIVKQKKLPNLKYQIKEKTEIFTQNLFYTLFDADTAVKLNIEKLGLDFEELADLVCWEPKNPCRDLMVCHKRNTELMTLPLSPLTFRH
jgi:serine O-acetyltransferase